MDSFEALPQNQWIECKAFNDSFDIDPSLFDEVPFERIERLYQEVISLDTSMNGNNMHIPHFILEEEQYELVFELVQAIQTLIYTTTLYRDYLMNILCKIHTYTPDQCEEMIVYLIQNGVKPILNGGFSSPLFQHIFEREPLDADDLMDFVFELSKEFCNSRNSNTLQNIGYLLNQGVDVNCPDRNGLMLVEYPFCYLEPSDLKCVSIFRFFNLIVSHPTFEINMQNIHGETIYMIVLQSNGAIREYVGRLRAFPEIDVTLECN